MTLSFFDPKFSTPCLTQSLCRAAANAHRGAGALKGYAIGGIGAAYGPDARHGYAFVEVLEGNTAVSVGLTRETAYGGLWALSQGHAGGTGA